MRWKVEADQEAREEQMPEGVFTVVEYPREINGVSVSALWDTVMYAFAGRSEEEIRPNREKIMAAFIKLAGSSAFRKIMVSQPKAVVARAEAFGSVMDAICGPRGGKRGAKTR